MALRYSANGAAFAPQALSALAGTRPEFASVEKIWRDVLAPELEKREHERRSVIARAKKRTAIAVVISVLAVFILAALFSVFAQLIVFALIALTLLSVAIIAGVDWLKVFSMKTATKDLILGAACAPFGLRYDTLHPDVSGISNLSEMMEKAKAYADSAQETSNNKILKTPLGAIQYSVGGASGPPCPTPAYDVLCEATLLPNHHRRKFEDLIEGERAGARFSLVEAKLDTTGKHGKTVFQGLLFHIEYPERFLGRTIIARSGWWKRGKRAGELKKVDLPSADLDRAFTIYSTDQVEARALLTPDRMERLLELETYFHGGKLRAIFEGGHITLALEAPNQFEAGSIFEPLVNPARFATALAELGQVCDLIDGYMTREWIAARR